MPIWATLKAVEMLTGRSPRTLKRDCKKFQWSHRKFPRQRPEFFSIADIEKSYMESFSPGKLLHVAERLNQLAVRRD